MESPPKDHRVSLRRRFFSLPTLLAFAVAAALLVFLVTRFDVDLGATWQNIRTCNPLYYVLAFGVNYTTFFFRGARWRVLLRNVQEPERPVPSTPYLSGLMLLSWFANGITWFRLGDAYRAYVYADDTGATFSRTIGTVVAERVFDVAVVFVIMGGAALALFLQPGEGPSWLFLGIALALLLGMVAILLLMVLFRTRFARFLPARLEEAYQRFHEGTLGSFRRVPLVVFLGLLGWLAEVARLYFVTQALGIPLGVPMVFFVTLASAILTLIPLTPSGLGIVEPGITGLLILWVSKSAAVSVTLLDRSISYLSVILIGALFFVLREAVKRWRANRRQVAAGRS